MMLGHCSLEARERAYYMASLKSRVSRKVLARCSEKESLKATMLAAG